MSTELHDLDTLRTALREGAINDPAARVGRLAGVQRAVVRRRRRQVSVGLAAAGLAVAAGIGGAWAWPVERAEQQPATRETGSLPEYQRGGRLLGQTRVEMVSGQTATLTVTPTAWGLALATACSEPDAKLVDQLDSLIIVSVGGQRLFHGGGCGGGFRGPWHRDQVLWRDVGVELGTPMTVQITVTGPQPTPPVTPTLLLGVYQDVPVADYPLPSLPATVPTTPPDGGIALPELLRSVEVGAGMTSGTVTRTLAYSPTLTARIQAWAPGEFVLALNGHEVGGASFWTYSSDAAQVSLDAVMLREAGVAVPRTGEPITITVTARRFASPAWRVRLGEEVRSTQPTVASSGGSSSSNRGSRSN